MKLLSILAEKHKINFPRSALELVSFVNGCSYSYKTASGKVSFVNGCSYSYKTASGKALECTFT